MASTPARTVPAEPTFLGIPSAAIDSAAEADIVILGVPNGVRYPGQNPDCAEAPKAIRERSRRFAGFVAHHDFDLEGPLLAGTDMRLVDCGDVPADTSATDAIRALLERGAVPIVLGGDDSVPIPILRAYEGHGPLTVVQIDAHLDFRDEVKGEREGYSSPMRRASEMPWVEKIVQVGLRGVGSATPADVRDAEAAGNALVTAREIHQLGIETVFDRLADEGRYFISLDCDGLDPSVMPAVNAPLPGGLTFTQCSELLRGLTRRGTIVGAVITELVPARDLNGLSATAAVRLIWGLIGAMARSVDGSQTPGVGD